MYILTNHLITIYYINFTIQCNKFQLISKLSLTFKGHINDPYLISILSSVSPFVSSS